MTLRKIVLFFIFAGIVTGTLFLLTTGGNATTLSRKYVGNEIVDLEWTEYTEGDFKEYRLYRDNEKIANYTDAANETFHRDPGLTKGTQYIYRLEVVDNSDEVVVNRTLSARTGEVTGVITLDTTWGSGEYNLTGDVIVEDDVRLSVGEDVAIYTHEYQLVLQGTISDLTRVQIYGKALQIDGRKVGMTDFTINNCSFDGEEGGSESGTALSLANLTVRIEGSTIENYEGGLHVYGDDCNITRTTIRNIENAALTVHGDDYYFKENTIEYSGFGIEVVGDNGDFIENTVENCSDGGIRTVGDLTVFTKNVVNDNKDYGMNLSGYQLRLEGNTVVGNSDKGIGLYLAEDAFVKDCNASENGDSGIYLEDGPGVIIRNNNIFFNDGSGIVLVSSDNALIEESSSGHNYYGIYLSRSSHNSTIRHNTVNANQYGIYIQESNDTLLTLNTVNTNDNEGIYVIDLHDCTATGNTVNYNEYGIFFYNVSTADIDNNTIEFNKDTGIYLNSTEDIHVGTHTLTFAAATGKNGISISYSDRIDIENVDVGNCENGIFVRSCGYVNVTGVTAYDNVYGMYIITPVDPVIIKDCEIFNNTEGITLYKVNDTVVRGNDINGNDVGIVLTTEEDGGEGSDHNMINNNTLEANNEIGISIFKSEENVFDNNTVNGTSGSAIAIERSGNNTFKYNIVSSSAGKGVYIYNWDGSVDNSFIGNTIKDNVNEGIYNRESNWNLFQENLIIGNGGDGISVELSGNCIFLENNISENSKNGLSLEGYGQEGVFHTLENNTFYDNEDTAIYVEDASWCTITNNTILGNTYGVEFKYEAINNVFRDNTIIENTEDEDSWAVLVDKEAEDNTLEKISVGRNYTTTISISSYENGSFQLKAVENPPGDPGPPEYTFKKRSIENYVEILSSHEETRVFVEFHYTEEQLLYGMTGENSVPEETLKIWRYTAGDSGMRGGNQGRADDSYVWLLGSENGTVPWNGSRVIDTENNIVGVEILAFSIFAPLGGYPVHNLDTDKDFPSIEEAVEDDDTDDGDLISVDVEYTGTKENMHVNKNVTIISSTGNREDTILQAKVPSGDVMIIEASGVRVEGFTIAGSEGNRGIWVNGAGSVTITDCIFRDNFYGIMVDDADDAVVTSSIFFSNGERSIYLDNSARTVVFNNTLEDGYGVYMAYAVEANIFNNSFADNGEMGVYVFEGERNTVKNNHFTGAKEGIIIDRTKGNFFIDNDIELSQLTGIRLKRTDGNHISGGSIVDAPTSVSLDKSNKNTFERITITTQFMGEVTGVLLTSSNDNTLKALEILHQSTPTGKSKGMLITSDSTNNLVDNITVSVIGGAKGAGVEVWSDRNNLWNINTLKVDASKSSVGLLLDGGHYNTVVNCSLSGSRADDRDGAGLRVNNSRNCRITDSSFTDNDIGILCENNSSPSVHWSQVVGNVYSGIMNKDEGVTINATNNWWGAKRGPAGVGPGVGDNVSEYVSYEPWISSEFSGKHVGNVSAGVGTIDTRKENNAWVGYDTTSNVTITTFKYDSNPGEGFLGNIGLYIDLHLDHGDEVNEIVVRMYYTNEDLDGAEETKLQMYWWSGRFWLLSSDTGVDTTDDGVYGGYIWAKLRDDTSPSLFDLTGTPFGAGDAGIVTHTITITIDDIEETIEPDAAITVSGNIIVEPDGLIQGVSLFLDGLLSGEAAEADGSYSGTITLPGDLSEGDHTLMVHVLLDTNESSNESMRLVYKPVVHIINVTVDTIKEVIMPDGQINVTGTMTVEPSGDIQSVDISLDGLALGTAVVNGTQYSGTVTLPQNLSEGFHAIEVYVTLVTGEKDGNFTTINYDPDLIERTITITIDEITETIKPGGDITVSGSVTVEPAAPIESVDILLDDVIIDTAEMDGGRYSVTITLPKDLSKDKHTITVELTLENGESDEESIEIINKKEPETGGGEEGKINIGIIILVVALLGGAVFAVLVKMELIPLGEMMGKLKGGEDESEEDEGESGWEEDEGYEDEGEWDGEDAEDVEDAEDIE